MTIFVVEIDTESDDPDYYGPFDEFKAATEWAAGRVEQYVIIVVEPPAAYPGSTDDEP